MDNKKKIIIIALGLIFINANIVNLNLVYAQKDEGYGEDNDNLGQFVDTFINDNNITIIDNLIVNTSLECVELNYSSMVEVIYGNPYLREHDLYVGKTPQTSWTIGSNDYIEMSSPVVPQGGGHIFIHVNRDWLNGKYVRWRWQGYYSGAVGKQPLHFHVRDIEYNRSNDDHFPEAQHVGERLDYYYIPAFSGWSGWQILDRQQNNLTTGTYDNCTVDWYMGDGWNGQSVKLQLDWIEINEGAGGTDNLITINFEDATNVVMEKTGTQEDYGYMNNTGLPFTSGGYDREGFLITTDYLNYTTGNTLVLITTTQIFEDTSITVQFSNDNKTWVDNKGNVGSNTLIDGFYSLELLDLNYTDSFLMYNLSGDGLMTPRLNQSRLITTMGSNVTTSEPSEDYAGLLIVGLILGIVLGIGVDRA